MFFKFNFPNVDSSEGTISPFIDQLSNAYLGKFLISRLRLTLKLPFDALGTNLSLKKTII